MIKIMEEEDEYLESDSNDDDSNSDPSDGNFSEGEIHECFNQVFVFTVTIFTVFKIKMSII